MEYKSVAKYLKKYGSGGEDKKGIGLINKFLSLILVFMLVLILVNSNDRSRRIVSKIVKGHDINFAKINNWYTKYFGDVLPFKRIVDDSTSLVFDEKIVYKSRNKYKDGVELDVGASYMVPAFETGVVVFIGKKEGYGNTIIVQQVNGVDVWYGNVKNDSIKVYDYISRGSLVGEAMSDKIYMVFQKDGKV